YGVWIVLGALTSYFGLLDLGIRASVGRHVAFHHSAGARRAVNETLSAAVVVLASVGGIAAAAVMLGGPLFFRFFDVPLERQVEAGLALKLVAVNLAVWLLANAFDATLWGFQRFDRINVVDIPVSLLRAGLTFTLIGSGGGLAVLAGITLGTTAAAGLA